ncbi:MAG: nucleoside-diphosphate sugar epimerase/dehydratase [Candidatus Krumholzibacteriia bacterium]
MAGRAPGDAAGTTGTRLLIVGAGEAGRQLVRQIQAERLPYAPVGFLDDDPGLAGRVLDGVPVLGPTDALVAQARRTGADEIIIAIPSSRGSLVRRLVPLCKRAGLPFKIVPGIRAIIEGDVHLAQVRPVAPEDLLGRESVTFQAGSAREVVQGRCVLVTGAGGSIGSELCRQLLPLEPRELLLLGRGENSIFEIATDLAPWAGSTRLRPVIADVRDAERMLRLTEHDRPELVLHAAAHKHVPLMEAFPEEAVLVNVGGTASVLAAARAAGAERFVLISTDKAVAPDNVMGATKKLAEQLVRQDAAAAGGAATAILQGSAPGAAPGAATRAMSVRFGNVLGSRGSVVPFFQRRIAAGLPLPVTDPRMTRYFMTIREAALLVIEAMVLGENGVTYILEMGEPVPIVELAHNLLALSGYDPGNGDDGPGIVFTGLRPGERLHEALTEEGELVEPSANPLIRRARPPAGSEGDLLGELPGLLELARAGDRHGLRGRLAELLGRPSLREPAIGDDPLFGPDALRAPAPRAPRA